MFDEEIKMDRNIIIDRLQFLNSITMKGKNPTAPPSGFFIPIHYHVNSNIILLLRIYIFQFTRMLSLSAVLLYSDHQKTQIGEQPPVNTARF
jgi:hypothetical protein